MIRPVTLLLFGAILGSAQPQERKVVIYTKQEQSLVAKLRALREFPEGTRGAMIKDTAIEIRRLPASLNKLRLADSLAFISTEGDPGRDTLQEAATTLIEALREHPSGTLDSAYVDLAQLAHYEHVTVSLNDPRFAAAVAQLEANDQHRREADFTLTDLNGKSWALKNLRGKVVLVTFWASGIRTCLQEMIELEALYQRFKQQDLVILAISGEKRVPVSNFVKAQKITFPVLLDPEQKVAQLFRVLGFPKTFVYDREGKLIAQAIDFRTKKQLLNMLEQAGLR